MEEDFKSKEQLIKKLNELNHRLERLERSEIEHKEIVDALKELRQLIQKRGREINEVRCLVESQFQRFGDHIEYVLLRLSFKERTKERISKFWRKVMPVQKDIDSSTLSYKDPIAIMEKDDQEGIIGENKTLIETMKHIESLPLEIYIATNWECNYNCTYCFSYKPTRKSEYRKHTAIEWENALYSIYQEYDKCRVTLTGGDPLLYNDAVDLVINATKYHYVSVGTNLSIGEEALRRIASESNLENLFISSSYHLEHSPIDIFIDKIMLLKSHGVGVYSSAVAYPGFITEMPKIKKKFEEMGLGIAFYPYMGMYEGRTFPSEYSTEELSILKELPGWHLIIDNNPNGKIELPRSKGILCYTGVKFIFVNPEGEVRRCVKVYQTLGNVFGNRFSLLKKPEPCPLEVCDCEVSGGDCILPFTVACFRQRQRFRLNEIG
jgi:MoaA/NifB/PqqE/SkfB family radical SAM enzyme/uncharacterized protein (UPF0335 family)